ncbi:lanthionine synthetase C family protein (plasmid) [Streptomyces viridifaciens]|nr:lanthionine synthetase C family protein [Streptomyces viridifaciens]
MTSAIAVPRFQELSEGALGVALLHIERGDLAAARRHLAQAVAGGVSTGGNASLFHGAPALEFVLGRAGAPTRQVREAADKVVSARLAAAALRRDGGALARPAEFDLIRGLAGLGALLLAREPAHPLLHQVLSYLVSLAQPVRSLGRELPGWWSEAGPADEEMPGGHGNLGVAHGVAGPLAVLALAARHGAEVAGQREAIEVFNGWLERHEHGYWITLDQLSARTPPGPVTARPSWCYGQLGIARTRQVAALALGDQARREAAEDAALRVLADPARLEHVTDASLCHGWAGLLAIVRAMATDSPAPGRFTLYITHLTTRLTATLGELPKPGFLEGRAGAQLALEGSDTTGWTRALLIA